MALFPAFGGVSDADNSKNTDQEWLSNLSFSSVDALSLHQRTIHRDAAETHTPCHTHSSEQKPDEDDDEDHTRSKKRRKKEKKTKRKKQKKRSRDDLENSDSDTVYPSDLLNRELEPSQRYEEKSSASLSPAHHQSHNPSGLKSSTSGTLPRLGPQPQHTPNALHTPPSRVCAGSAAVQHHTLNELIVVHGLPLRQRHTTAPEHTTHDSEERMSLSKPRPRRSLEQSPSPLPRPPPSSRRRPLPPRTLLPLTQSSTAGNMEDIIRGTRLAPAGDRLSSSAMTLSRNTLLPPIGTADKEHTHTGHHTRLSQRHRAPSSHAHSAVADEAGSLLAFSRPNTTHTFRSDTPHRRSFTVLDSSGSARPGRASVGTDSLGIGVTGISLGISSSSFLDSFTIHTLDHSPIEDGAEPEGRALPPALLVPVSLQSHSRGGLMTRSNRPGP
ncbi:hypothetical protein PHYPO_G00020600 [Pangasianodon hypophthalmus]|uniref:Uncharacterized protein n=1 Tax=Pangasianodon hypophthalmus TaxID=310915 RepID=A0A5N5N5E6_PANHP|nr:hypothetical protein PHYPO_G00020600 [Pangasianodon hypophthalmus]